MVYPVERHAEVGINNIRQGFEVEKIFIFSFKSAETFA